MNFECTFIVHVAQWMSRACLLGEYFFALMRVCACGPIVASTCMSLL